MNPTTDGATKSGSTDGRSPLVETDSALSKLYQKLLEFDIDGQPAEFSFSCRLARENGWSIEYARRVEFEYKRFLLLAVVTDHPVTPSRPVDQAWHLHLTYTRSYWERLCGEVLGRAVHHQPGRGGPNEVEKYRSQYLQTLRSYQRIFGSPSDPEIWPRPPHRLEKSAHSTPAGRPKIWFLRWPVLTNRTLIKRAVLVVCFATAALTLLPTFLAYAQGSAEANSDGIFEAVLLILLLAFIVLLIIGVYYDLIVASKCSACGRTWALKGTGNRKDFVHGTIPPATDLIEQRCKYCNNIEWTEVTRCGG